MTILQSKRLLVAFSLACLLLCKGAYASPKSNTSDIALQKGGVLQGQIVNAQGAPLANSRVSLFLAGKEVTRVATNKNGQFTVMGLKGGIYQVATNGHQGVYRCWAPHTAPPKATKGLFIVANSDVVRAQDCGSGVKCGSGCGGGGLIGWMADHPVITAGAIGAAIAIPLATDDDDPASP